MKADDAALQERRELCRHEVRRYLAERSTLAFAARTIRQRLNANRQADWAEDEIEKALKFLEGLEQVEGVRDGLGSTRHYEITSDGVLAYERSGG